jgi:hypothetical protein
MWNRDPLPGEPVEDMANHRVGIVVAFDHTSDTVRIVDAEHNEWDVPLADIVPFSVVSYCDIATEHRSLR